MMFLWGLKKLCQEGRLQEAVEIVDLIEHQGQQVTADVFCCLVQACIDKKDLEAGRQVHSRIVRNKVKNVFIGNRLIHMFVTCGSLLEANEVFSKLAKPNVFTWSAIISAHTKFGQDEHAIRLYFEMQQANVRPDTHVFVAVVTACANATALQQGRIIHAHIRQNGLETNVFIGNALINMYAKCQSLKDAVRLFNRLPRRDAVTWGAMITGYTQHGNADLALQLFEQMQEEVIEPNRVTFICVLKACSGILGLDRGKWVHKLIVKSRFEFDLSVGNTLIDMYVKCQSLDDARAVFDRLPIRDRVTWSVIIGGCDHHGQGEEALCLFQKMQEEGLEPDRIAFVSTLKACSSTLALELGRLIHSHIIGSGLSAALFIGNALLDMYAKCGSLKDAWWVFDKLPKKDIAKWNAMIGGLAQHNDCKFALQCLNDMQHEGLKPNDITLLSFLSACSHAGLVDEGFEQFRLCNANHGIEPAVGHHNCMVNLLCNAGQLKDAEDLLLAMPFGQNVVGWMSLLSHCRIHGDIDQAHRCFDQVVAIDHRKSSGYVLLSQILGYSGLQKDAINLEELRKFANAWKKPAKAFIEVDNELHHFTMKCLSFPHSDNISAKVKRLSMQMKEDGYMPHLEAIQQQLMQDTDKEILCGP